MSFASDSTPAAGFAPATALFCSRSLLSGFIERVSLPLLLAVILAGFIVYSAAAGATVGRLAVFVGILVAGMVSGISGLAFPLIAGPIFLLIDPAPEAVALTAMCSLTGQLFSIALLWRAISYEFRLPLIAAGLFGAPLGSGLLCGLNPHCVRVVLGALIVVSGLWRSLRVQTRATRTPSLLSEVVVGLTGGLTGGLVGASSVVPAIWCAACGFDKSHQRAVTQPYILAMQAASLVSLWAWGALDSRILGQYVDFVLPLLAGVGLGVAGFRGLSSGAATRVVMAAVTASGLAFFFL
jgi:uncharacterized protein